jgi:hypothetical protein
MNGASVFSPRVLIGWVAAAAVIFLASLYLMARGESGKGAGDSIGPSSFSRSAIGYAGLAEVLRRLGVPVISSQYDSLARLKPGSILILAEPEPTFQSLDELRLLVDAPVVLLILPKWQGAPSARRADWIGSAALLPEAVPQLTLGLAVDRGSVVRRPAAGSWTTNELGPVPTLGDPIQLIRADRLRPIVAAADGILLGEIRSGKRRLWVLADPDVMANHGIGRGANADFAIRVVDALRGGDGSIVFDETIHGFLVRPGNPAKLLIQFPFVFATAQAALTIVLLLWATTGRFGAPEAVPQALLAGKAGLVKNAAALLAYAGHRHVVAWRYVQATLHDTARQLRAPRGLSEGALLQWLGRVGEARAVTIDCAAVCRRAEAIGRERQRDLSPLLGATRDIHRWKQEIIDAAGRHPRDH